MTLLKAIGAVLLVKLVLLLVFLIVYLMLTGERRKKALEAR